MSTPEQISIVLELTRDEALGIYKLIGTTCGTLGDGVYHALSSVFEATFAASEEARQRFPDLRGGTGRFA
jgi:hypothetical protein